MRTGLVWRRRAVLAVATSVVAALGAGGVSAGAAAPTATGRVRVAQSLPAIPAGAAVQGALPASQTLRLDVALAVPDPDALDAFVTAVSTTSSPDYGHFLSAGQFAERFGPPPAAVAAVRSWLTEEGLDPAPATSDGLFVPVRGTAGAVERAFATTLVSVRLASGRVAYAPRTEASVPVDLATTVAGVVGLNDLNRAHNFARQRQSGAAAPSGTAPDVHAQAAGPRACPTASSLTFSGGPVTFTALAGIYDLTPLYAEARTGAGVTIAVYELGGFDSSDIDAFQQCYGISVPIRTETVDGGSPVTGTFTPEPALDIEELSAVAPGSNLLVYEGPNTSLGPIDTYDRIATDDAARVVSSSWGECEPTNIPANGGTAALEAPIFAEMAAQGQSMLDAAGDSGSEGCYLASSPTPNKNLAADDPASQPDVTGVGGTSLPETSAAPGAEHAWNACYDQALLCSANPAVGAGGGGLSEVWQMPAWQAAAGNGTVNPYSSEGSCGQPHGEYCREVPDVSSDADPDTGSPYFWRGGWSVFGGTSMSSPLWAGLIADAEQGCASSFGFLNPALYALGAAGSPAFNDVTAPGNNDLTDTNGGSYPTSSGYDLATGWGSPNGAALTDALQPSGGCPSVVGLSAGSGPIGGGNQVTVYGSDLSGASAVDFGNVAAPIVAESSGAVTVSVPGVVYSQAVYVTVRTANGTSAGSPPSRYVYGTPRNGAGYWLGASDGGVFSYGDAGFFGSMGGRPLVAAVVGMAATPDDDGYWEVAGDGGIFAFGDAGFFGSMGGRPLAAAVVGLATTPDGGGYWEVAADGGTFAFGDAAFYGSMGGHRLNAPVVALAPTPDGGGYWEVASDGGIFAFGDAAFFGSMGGRPLNASIVGIAPAPDGRGYWEVASDGGIFAFGDANYYGSMGGRRLNAPIVGVAALPTGTGYWEVASDGGIFAFGDANFFGSAGALKLSRPVVAIAST